MDRKLAVFIVLLVVGFIFVMMAASDVLFSPSFLTNSRSEGSGSFYENNFLYVDDCMVLDQPNRIYVQNNDIVPLFGPCIDIVVSGVTFDGNGYSISNPDLNAVGIYSNQPETEIRNVDVTMSDSGLGIGIKLDGADNSYIHDNILNDQSVGLHLRSASNSIIENNVANSNAFGFEISESSNYNVFNGNILDFNYNRGLVLHTSSGNNEIRGNSLSSNLGGITLDVGGNNLVEDNYIYQSGVFGGLFIETGSSDNQIIGNVIDSSLGDAIRFSIGDITNNVFEDVSVVNTNPNFYDIRFGQGNIQNTHLIDTHLGRYDFGQGGIVIFEDKDEGKIEFLENLVGLGEDLSEDVMIEYNSVTVESENNDGLNKGARISLYDLPGFTNPVVLRDGEVCGEACSLISFEDGIAVFEVLGWAIYSIGES